MGNRQADSAPPRVEIEPSFPDGYPPTVWGITWAVKQWEPLVEWNGVETRLKRIFHDVEIEEDLKSLSATIYAYIDPALAEKLTGERDFGTREAIEKSLAGYLEHYRPVGVQFVVRVCLAPVGERGPYR